MVGSQPCAGNNTMHMDMVTHLLIPCVEHLYDAWEGPEELRIGGKFQEGFRRALVEEPV